MKKRALVVATHYRELTSGPDGRSALIRKKFEEPVEGFVVGRSWGLFQTAPHLGEVWLVESVKGEFYTQPLLCLEEDVLPMPSFEEMPPAGWYDVEATYGVTD